VKDYIDIATRDSGSVNVALSRHRVRGDLVVVAKDRRTGHDVMVPVDGTSATEVYRDPFAYASQSLS
jgi:hypothetical protein